MHSSTRYPFVAFCNSIERWRIYRRSLVAVTCCHLLTQYYLLLRLGLDFALEFMYRVQSRAWNIINRYTSPTHCWGAVCAIWTIWSVVFRVQDIVVSGPLRPLMALKAKGPRSIAIRKGFIPQTCSPSEIS